MSAKVVHSRTVHYVDIYNDDKIVCSLRCNDMTLLSRIVKLNWGITI